MDVAALRSGDPERLGRYALVGRIGEGGQGTVFLAEDGDGARVALKLLHSDLTEDDKARARFLRELEVAKKVAPFCTAQVLDADADGERPYIVSEYVPGPSLNALVLEQGPLGGAALERLAVGTATALAAIHQADIIHRDFKPHNVLIGADGPRLIDFGVARAISGSTTLTSRVIGTPSYMAPEQLQGDEIGPPADVFCWAATLVFAATGEPPFGQDTIPAVINRILHNEPELGDLDGALRELVVDCLRKEPADRPNARQLLMRLLGHEERAAAGPAQSLSLRTAATPDLFDDDDLAGESPDDATAILAAGSVLAAELGEDRALAAVPSGAPADDLDEDGQDDEDDDSGRPRPPRDLIAFDQWAEQNTLPPEAISGESGGRLRRAVTGPRRMAVLAGAAAAAVAVTIISTVLVLSGGDKGKTGHPVSDSQQPVPAASSEPSIEPSTPVSTEPRERPAPVTTEPPDSPSPSPSDSGTLSPTSRPTSPTPGPSDTPTSTPTDEPTDEPTTEPPG